jgi:peptidyl-prolyl cis-trans isomerase C
MTIRVNGQEIGEAAIVREAELHTDAPDPREAAATALVMRRIIVDQARSRGLLTRDELEPADADLDDALDALLALEAPIPEPEEDELRYFYAQNRTRFCVGERVHAAHILFAVKNMRLADTLRARAEALLQECVERPDRFAEAARELSNCPSGAHGGDLGWLARGECVPEFERVLFAATEPGLWPRPVATRFGWHLIRIIECDSGRPLAFEEARAMVAMHLRTRSRRKAAAHYVQRLAAQARVEGIHLHLQPGWLMQ